MGDDTDRADAIVRNIASFLSLSDAASIQEIAETPADSWAVGVELDYDSSWDVETPLTPALVAISPGATPRLELYDKSKGIEDEDSEYMEEILQERRRRWAQEKLAKAVFFHPQSLRAFCLDAYTAAQEIRNKHQPIKDTADPETLREPDRSVRKRKRRGKIPVMFAHEVLDFIFQNVPLSVVIDILEAMGEISLDTTFASLKITVSSVNAIFSALGRLVRAVWKGITSLNPFHLLEAIISLQFNAMGRTSEVIVGGIQSVATGVGSASSLALHRISNASLSGNLSSSSLLGDTSRRAFGLQQTASINKKLLRKMSTINSAAKVVAYREIEDDTGGLTKHAKHRVQRMMHYDISLRPFVATVEQPDQERERIDKTYSATPSLPNTPVVNYAYGSRADMSSASSASGTSSPFMCTPQSFPPTPHSRHVVLTKGIRMADDVVFLARDRLRVYGGMQSENEKTREMARALREGRRLAVFDARDSTGIELSCGQHIATKVGNILYCTTKSMVPILRNCFVYFEITCMPRPPSTTSPAPSMATLSVGVATEELPSHSLVGNLIGSIGLCSTGQVLAGGQWFTPVEESAVVFGEGSTIGCLVMLDDRSAFETWDGVMVTASVTFNVNGVLVMNPVTTMPVPSNVAGAVTRFDDTPKNVSIMGVPKVDPRFLPSSQSTPLPLLVPAAEELFPTVTLHSPFATVMCRFSSEDVIAESRSSIGAPEGLDIYAVDGSIIFSTDTES